MLGKNNSSTRLMRDLPHDKDLTCVIDRVCFDEHYIKSCRGCAVQIAHARFLCPDERVISVRACRTCRTPNHIAQVVDIKSSARISAWQHSEILHSIRCSPQKRAQASRTLRVSNNITSIINCDSLA